MAGPEAKAGIENEDYIVNILNQFRSSEKARNWLKVLGYDISKIKELEAKRSLKMGLGNIKSDAILFVNQKSHGIQIKKSRKDVNFNHLQRGWTDNVCKEWDAPIFISNALKKFAGEDGYQPADYMSEKELKELQSERKKKGFSEKKIKDLVRRKRLLLSELEEKERKEFFAWFEKNKKKIVAAILRGDDKKYQPRHLLVVEHIKTGEVTRIGIVTMSEAIAYFSEGHVMESPTGTVLCIGKIMLQRHGSEAEGKRAQHLQLKIKPLGVFEIPNCKIFR